MKVALAIADQTLEREVLRHLIDEQAQVVRRCLTGDEAEAVAPDVELIVDRGFLTRQAVHRRHRIISDVSELVTPIAPASDAMQRPGRLIPFVATSGGIGATSLTVYSAAQAAAQRKNEVLVIDADLWHPSAALFALTDSTNAGGQLIDALTQPAVGLRDIAVAWEAGVWVLGGVDAASRRAQVTQENWSELLRRATHEFSEVRVDVGAHVFDAHPVVEETLRSAQQCVIVSGAHPISAVHARSVHDRVASLCQQVVHVVNRMAPGPIGVTAYRILTAALASGVEVTVPEDEASFSQAFIDGSSLAPMSHSPAYRAIELLNERLTSPAGTRASRSSPFGRVISLGR